MKRILYLSGILFLSSCLSEKNIDPGKPSTFVRYFNGGNNDYAQVAEETPEGYIVVLGTTKITSPNAPADSSKIKLIKTDRYGNTLAQKVFPDFGSSSTTLAGNALLQITEKDLIAKKETLVEILVAGTQITPSRKDLMIMKVDAELGNPVYKTIDFTAPPWKISESIEARAIQLNKNGNYLVLASLQSDTYNMLLAELDKTTLAINWVELYGAGTSSLGNKIFLDGTAPLPNVYWSGTVTRNSTDIRFVKTAQNSRNTIFDLPIGKPGFIEEGHDLCKYGLGFIVVGNSNESGNQDILFKVLTENGTELFSKTLSDPPGTPDNEKKYGDADTGNAVCATSNGFVVLGSVKSKGQDDYFMMKYDGFGNDAWTEPRIFGNSTRNDNGASIRQLSDGSLLVLGTTVFGGVRTMMLMKANSEGEIE